MVTDVDIKLSFDLSEIAQIASLKRTEVETLTTLTVRRLAEAVIFHWREEASKSLYSTRAAYKNGIQLIDIDDKSAIVALLGNLNNMIESGSSPFDIKVGMSHSSKRKLKAKGKGWYITVPFRWATAMTLGENEVFSNRMPLEVYEVAKELEETLSAPNKKVVYGGKVVEADLSKSLQGRRTRPAYGKFGAYQHKSNIYEGIIREEKTYEKTTQSKYFSFRRISDLSDPDSWIHPGFSAKNLAEKAVQEVNIDAIVNSEANKFINSL